MNSSGKTQAHPQNQCTFDLLPWLHSTLFSLSRYRVSLHLLPEFSNMAKVDATILEVGVGGAYDSTNIVPKPIVTGVSALGIDHVTVLGNTIEEIAWQKGGIFKVSQYLLFVISS